VTLRRAGYLDSQVLLDRDASCNESVQLEPSPTHKPAEKTGDKPASGKKSGKTPKAPKKPETSHADSFSAVD
jgi:hypothetical protein